MTQQNSFLLSQFKMLEKANKQNIDTAFCAYCQSVLSQLDKKVISQDTAARSIAAAMFIPSLDAEPLREEITMYAGELETPMSAPDRRKKWKRLEELVAELAERSKN